jgi:hypothetical protein
MTAQDNSLILPLYSRHDLDPEAAIAVNLETAIIFSGDSGSEETELKW